VGPIAGLDATEKRKNLCLSRESNHVSSAIPAPENKPLNLPTALTVPELKILVKFVDTTILNLHKNTSCAEQFLFPCTLLFCLLAKKAMPLCHQ
jgi:hypothetical protein